MTLILTKPIACWQEEYVTGNPQVDGQHQQIFELVNTLHDAVVTGANITVLQELLEDLANHTIEHFQTEEALMMAVNYPDYKRHKLTHDRLLATVNSLLIQIREHDFQYPHFQNDTLGLILFDLDQQIS